MKTSKLGLIIALGGLVALSPLAQGQEKDKPKDDAKPAAPKAPGAGKAAAQDRMKQIAEELGLSEEQKEKLKPITQEQGEKVRAVFGDANLSQEDKRTKMQELRTAYSAKVKAILTPEQGEKWDKLQAQQAQQFGKKKKQQ